MYTENPEIQVCLSPQLLPLFSLKDCVVVVADILRATSCMVTALAHGVSGIIPVASLEEAKKYQENGFITAAERDGDKVPGFDLDNSPFSYMKPLLQGKTVVVTTTNGTQAIRLSAEAHQIIVGAFLNLSTVTNYLIQTQKPVLVVCAGWKGNICIEDTLFAGAICHRLTRFFQIRQDAAQIAWAYFQNHQNHLLQTVSEAQHAHRLFARNIIQDIEFCLTFDTYNVLPAMQGNLLQNMLHV